ncbi:hypothetical protein MMC11_007420 [Xylographa trunciseda]|nr:hypothetical protein [Xylographa trunciseda]
MAGFLNLARELRDLIYLVVLQAEIAPPSSSTESGPRRNNIEGFMHTIQPVLVNSKVLLLVNHQVHDEVQEAIRVLKKSGELRYKLDCMLVGEAQIYPTWLSIPVFSTRVSKVEVSFRSIGNCGLRSPESRLASCGYDTIAQRMYTLLRKFLKEGPDFRAGAGGGYMMTVDELILNIVTPSPIPTEGYRTTHFPDPNEISLNGLLHPEAVVEEIIGNIDFLLCRSNDQISWFIAPYAAILFDRVRFIKILLEGELKKIWNIKEIDAHNPKRLH